jgi:hypothetical protein
LVQSVIPGIGTVVVTEAVAVGEGAAVIAVVVLSGIKVIGPISSSRSCCFSSDERHFVN